MCVKLYEYFMDENKPDEGKRYLRQALKFIDINEFSPIIYNFDNYKSYIEKLLM